MLYLGEVFIIFFVFALVINLVLIHKKEDMYDTYNIKK